MFQGYDVFLLPKINCRPMLGSFYKCQVVGFVQRLKLSSLVPSGMNRYDASALSDSSQGTKEVQHRLPHEGKPQT